MKKSTKKTNRRKRNRRKKKMPFATKVMIFFLFSAWCFCASSLVLRSYNNQLSVQLQSIEEDIIELQVKNDSIETEINQLENRERIESIASDAGLKLTQSNIVSITTVNE